MSNAGIKIIQSVSVHPKSLSNTAHGVGLQDTSTRRGRPQSVGPGPMGEEVSATERMGLAAGGGLPSPICPDLTILLRLDSAPWLRLEIV